jgi:hypothetical protein
MDMASKQAVRKTMVWQKVQSTGYKPSAREGHTLVSAGSKVYVFGGVETGRRVNSVQVLDVLTGQWSAHAVGNAGREKEAIVSGNEVNWSGFEQSTAETRRKATKGYQARPNTNTQFICSTD